MENKIINYVCILLVAYDSLTSYNSHSEDTEEQRGTANSKAEQIMDDIKELYKQHYSDAVNEHIVSELKTRVPLIANELEVKHGMHLQEASVFSATAHQHGLRLSI